MKHNIQVIAEEMGNLDATYISSERAIAHYIDGYIKGRRIDDRIDFIEAAIQAYAKLLQDFEVKVASDG